MSTLSDSYIYGMFNVNKMMSTKIADAYKEGQTLDSSYIEEQILQIKRTRISPLSDAVLTAFSKGEIELIYSSTVKVPKAIPFIILKIKGRNKAIIFVNNYGSISNNGIVEGGNALNVPMKDLYTLMESAYLALRYYDNPSSFRRSIGLMKLTNSIYTNMWIRILNKECALSMNPELFNQVSFCISKYYLEKVWEIENDELVFNYACSEATNANKITMKLVENQYNQANVQTIDDLFKFLQTFSVRIENKVSTKYMVECYINMYRDTALLGIDTLPYFIFTIVCAYCGSFIVNQPLINDIMKNIKSVNILYSELSKLG